MKIEFVIKAGIIKHNLSGIPVLRGGETQGWIPDQVWDDKRNTFSVNHTLINIFAKPIIEIQLYTVN